MRRLPCKLEYAYSSEVIPMKLKAIYCVNIILTLIVLIGNYFYQDKGFYYPLKMLCSASFGLMGILNFIYMLHSKATNRKLLLFLLLGILFSWGGDIVLNIDFVSGAAVFALGHVFFVIAYFIYQKGNKLDLLLCSLLVLFSICFIQFFPPIYFEIEVFHYVCLAYAAIISIMVGKSLGNALLKPSSFTVSLLISSIAFFISDLMLLLAWFSSVTGWTSNMCMALYYPAMCFFAVTLLNPRLE